MPAHKHLRPFDDPSWPLDIIKDIGTNNMTVGPDGLQRGNDPDSAHPPWLSAVLSTVPVCWVDRDSSEYVDQTLLVHNLGNGNADQELGGDTDILHITRVVLPVRCDGLVLDMVPLANNGPGVFLFWPD